jgi:hypothetical protein
MQAARRPPGKDQEMATSKVAVAVALIAGLLIPAGEALACGGVGAMVPMVPMMAGPMAGAAVLTMAAPAVAAAVAVPAAGATVSVLPQGYVSVVVNGVGFFRAGPTWYQPFDGPQGKLYRVVPAPHGM